MKSSRHTPEQVAFGLRQTEEGAPVAEVSRKIGHPRAGLLPLEEEVPGHEYRGSPPLVDVARLFPAVRPEGGYQEIVSQLQVVGQKV